jgi:hypothetical protein
MGIPATNVSWLVRPCGQLPSGIRCGKPAQGAATRTRAEVASALRKPIVTHQQTMPRPTDHVPRRLRRCRGDEASRADGAGSNGRLPDRAAPTGHSVPVTLFGTWRSLWAISSMDTSRKVSTLALLTNRAGRYMSQTQASPMLTS